jgi:uncharacterized protein (TIGR00251 family)
MSVDLRVHVQPRASKSEIVGWRDNSCPAGGIGALPVLAVRLTAPPVEGAANRACRDFLARALGIRPAQVTLVAGEKSREKRFRLEGIAEEEVRERVERARGARAPGTGHRAP